MSAEGYPLGTGKVLQIQELLDKLPTELSDSELAAVLVPIFARNPEEQDYLYELFQKCVAQVDAKLQAPEKDTKQLTAFEEEGRRWRLRILIPALILGAFALWGIFKIMQPPVSDNIEDIAQEINKIDSTNHLQDHISAVDSSPQSGTQTAPPASTELFKEKPYPYPHKLADYALPPPTPAKQIFIKNWYWLRWLLAGLLTALLAAIWQYRAWKRRKIIAERPENEKPPYFWNIEFEESRDYMEDESVEAILQLMRNRAKTDTQRLDVAKTIHATVEQGGLPSFQYRRQSAPVDYLLLIDRQSKRNHRSRLFDALYEQMKAQEIEVARYFYDSDVRVCYDEVHPHGLSLRAVQQKHYAARLIVIGTGLQLLRPTTGKTAPWTDVFKEWKNRSLLTPKPLKNWGYEERQLAQLFTLLPASLGSMAFWLDQLDAGSDAKMETWREKVSDAFSTPIHVEEADPIPMLRLYFDRPMMQWLAACALYPTLHYDLTLWWGKQLETAEKSLVSLENLRNLFRLPWFVEGAMPDVIRAALLDWLEKEDPELLLSLRTALATQLEQHAPPENSAAYDAHRMNVAMNRWLSETDPAKKRALEAEIASLLESGEEADFTVLKYLDRQRSPLDFIVPNTWRKYVYPGGHRALGWIRDFKDLLWLIPLFLIGLFFLFKKYNVQAYDCSTDALVTHTVGDVTHTFCMTDVEQCLVYQEHLVQEAFAENDIATIDTLLGPDARLDLDSSGQNHPLNIKQILASQRLDDAVKAYLDAQKPFDIGQKKKAYTIPDSSNRVARLLWEREQNFALNYYSLAKSYYENGQKDSACIYLNYARALDSLDIDFINAQNALCRTKEEVIAEQKYKIKPILSGSVSTNSIQGALRGLGLNNVQVRGEGIITKTNVLGVYVLKLPPNYPKSTIRVRFSKENYKDTTVIFKVDGVQILPKIFLSYNAPSKPIEEKPEVADVAIPSDTPAIVQKPTPIPPPTEQGTNPRQEAPETKDNWQLIKSNFVADPIALKGKDFFDDFIVNGRNGRLYLRELTTKGTPEASFEIELEPTKDLDDAKKALEPLQEGMETSCTIQTIPFKLRFTGVEKRRVNGINRNVALYDLYGKNVNPIVIPPPVKEKPKPVQTIKINQQEGKDFIKKHSRSADYAVKRYDIPREIVLALAILQSNYGTTQEAEKANNFFALKCGSDWNGSTFDLYSNTNSAPNECFRSYKKERNSFQDFGEFLKGKKRYAFLFEVEDLNYKDWAEGLQMSGFSTDPNFEVNLIALMEGLGLVEPILPPLEESEVATIPIPKMVFVQGGTFTMGCKDGRDTDCEDDEKPAHEVTHSDFQMSATEVTVGQYLAFCDATKSNYPEWLEAGSYYHIETGTDNHYKSKGYSRTATNLPITGVSWDNANAYCAWLAEKTGKGYRLPTEAEWEYAARGGQKAKKDYIYSGSNDIEKVAWNRGNSDNKPHEVGGLAPNDLGLFDMSGNVYEWCSDWYGSYSSERQRNPTGAEKSVFRVLRGGGWNSDSQDCRLVPRNHNDPRLHTHVIGFRLVFPV